jgi:hypothetical protein
MKNTIVCPNCSNENPFYKLTCSKCKTHLRDRISNIDFGSIIIQLIESPVRAFENIIRSEHKNFILFIIILSTVKIFINARFLSLLIFKIPALRLNLELELLIVFAAVYILIWILTLIIFYSNKISGLITRVKDDHAILIYSLIPFGFALIVLFPVELIVFGSYLFSNNPSPFIIKPVSAYVMLSFEGLIILWSTFLSISGLYSVSRNMVYSLCLGVSYMLCVLILVYILSILLFI